MNRSTPLLCALLCALALPTARASDPVTYKELALLLRNGEQQQYIMDETARRKLLRPLTQDEEPDLVSLGATPGLIKLLESPAVFATAESTAAYNARIQQQKLTQRQQEENDQLAAQKAALPPLAQPHATPNADEYAGQKIDLQFTAADGSEVSLAKLRGKVVLIDFWATWCGPCMGEVPHVVAAYKKYHDQGFEIIGISLDKDEETMVKVTREKEMTWPQYFDGKGWQNAMAARFNIRAIPTMWLINKGGILAVPNARADLEGEIAKLLAE